MIDPNQIRHNVSLIVKENEKDGTGWKRYIPFLIAIGSLDKIDVVYFKDKQVYVMNGAVYTPAEMRDYLLLRRNVLTPQILQSLPNAQEYNVKTSAESMSISLFPFAQYDQMLHTVFLWYLDDEGNSRHFAEVSVPFFFYQYSFIKVILMNMPDIDMMEDLWSRLVYVTKKGYAYTLDNRNMWKMVKIGKDVILGHAPFQTPTSSFYVTSDDEIINPAVDPQNHPITYETVKKQYYQGTAGESKHNEESNKSKHEDSEKIPYEKNIPTGDTKSNLKESEFYKRIDKWMKNLGLRDNLRKNVAENKAWEQSFIHDLCPVYENESYTHMPPFDTKISSRVKDFTFESVGNSIHLFPFYPILKGIRVAPPVQEICLKNFIPAPPVELF
jgi:hypothetical protein